VDRSEREVAALLDVTLGTARSQASKALARLRRCYPGLAGATRSDPGMGGGSGQELTVWARTISGDIEVHWVPD
jgi:hypothetical protein